MHNRLRLAFLFGFFIFVFSCSSAAKHNDAASGADENSESALEAAPQKNTSPKNEPQKNIAPKSGQQKNTAAKNETANIEAPKKITRELSVAIPPKAVPGEYITVIYSPAFGLEPKHQKLKAALYRYDPKNQNGKKIASAAFFKYKLKDSQYEVEAALLAAPSTSGAGPAVIKVEAEGAVLSEIPFEILVKEFKAEVIPLNPSNTSLRTEPDPQKTKEAELLWKILATTGTNVWSSGSWTTPVPEKTRRSSFFGDRRVYKYSNGKSDTSVHAGIDYAVPKGTSVLACAEGKALLARPRIVTGNSIIIEHLPGVYSIYYHLEEIKVKEGAVVKQGELIGLSGSTGLSTGPHLHWEIRVSTENADPDAFCYRSPLQDDLILNLLLAED